MFVYIVFVCLMAVSSTQAAYTYKIMDMKVPELTKPKQCPMLCDASMKLGLKGVDQALTELTKNLTFKTGFCDCSVQGLGNFKFSQTCARNEEGTMFDHKLRIQFVTPYASCSCPLPRNSKVAVDKINDADSPVGKCGKDKAGNLLPIEPVKGCDNDDVQSENKEPIQLEAKMDKPMLEAAIRVDTRGPEHVYPTSISLTFREEHFITLEKGPGFEKTFECITNKVNKVNFYRKIIFNVFKPVFDCLDDQKEHSRSLIDTILYFTGNCNNFNMFGL